ncbi:MAG: ABC transporter substrate-binding protein, partial [Pseudomonadota bacterium]
MLGHVLRKAAVIMLLGAASTAAAQPPARVVSMNLCTDQLAMLIASPGQLVSVSYLARDPASSAMAAEAQGYD